MNALMRTLRAAIKLTADAAPRELTWGLILQISNVVATVAQLFLLKRVLDVLTGNEAQAADALDALPSALGVAGLLLFSRAASAVSTELVWLLSTKLTFEVDRGIARRALAAELTEFDDAEFHDNMRRAHEEVSGRTWYLTRGLFEAVRSIVSAAAIGAVLWSISPAIVLVGVAAVAPSAWTLSRIARIRYGIYAEQTALRRERNQIISIVSSRRSAKEARLYRLGQSLFPDHERLATQILNGIRSQAQRRVGLAMLSDLFLIVVLAGATAWGLRAISNGSISLAEGGVVVVALLQLFSRLRALTSSSVDLREAGMHLDNYLTWTAEVEGDLFAHATGQERGGSFVELRFEDVSFRYPGTTVNALEPVSFALRPGELMVVRGPNGSGKSTLMSLLSGLLEPTTGRIVFDNGDTGDVARKRLREMTSAQFQDITRFEIPLDRAIGAEDQVPDLERVTDALRRSTADAFIETTTDGSSQRLGRQFEGGREFSSGQWQRLTLARALYQQHSALLILDEPTSMQDAASQEAIRSLLLEPSEQRASVLVTHHESNDGALTPTTTLHLAPSGDRAQLSK